MAAEPDDPGVADQVPTAASTGNRPQPSRRTLALIVTPIVLVLIVGTIGNAIHPTLVANHPLLLVAMEPRNRFLLLVANRVDYVPFLLVATVRRLFSDPLFYLLGYLYGTGGVKWVGEKMADGGALMRTIERGFTRAAPVMVFLLPGAVVGALAGATGMNPVLFVVLNVAGTVTIVTIVYRFAESVEGPLSAVNGFYADNSRWLTIGSIVVTMLYVTYQQRKGKGGGIGSVEELEAELTEPGDDAGTRRPRDGGSPEGSTST